MLGGPLWRGLCKRGGAKGTGGGGEEGSFAQLLPLPIKTLCDLTVDSVQGPTDKPHPVS